MKDFVSYRARSLVGWIASMSIICSALSPYGLPWPVQIWASLALATGGLLVLLSNPSTPLAMQRAGLPPRETRTR